MSGQSYATKLIPPKTVAIQPWVTAITDKANLQVDIMRLDEIHPVISGNKYFKLIHPVSNALASGRKGIISFGGAYSNHLLALAACCNELGLEALAFVRGEPGKIASPTLEDARGLGMKLNYLSRTEYDDAEKLMERLQDQYPDYAIVPAGGCSAEGVLGASGILSLVDHSRYDIIVASVGTGTTVAGLAASASAHLQVLGFSSLKTGSPNEIEKFIARYSKGNTLINYDFHFGGYAKWNQELINFMNECWESHGIPTDFVYTAKMFFGLQQLIGNGYFRPGTSILAIHSGGLQGNRSIEDKLVFKTAVDK